MCNSIIKITILKIRPGMGDAIIKLRWSHLIFLMEIPILIKLQLYIDMAPRALIQYKEVILPV